MAGAGRGLGGAAAAGAARPRPPAAAARAPRRQADLDLGNYERFLDISLSRDNNLTTGKVDQAVIERERRGDYLGKTVQVRARAASLGWAPRRACRVCCTRCSPGGASS